MAHSDTIRRFAFIVLVFLLGTAVSSCNQANGHAQSGKSSHLSPEAYSLSVSSDGNYAISVHADRRVILWDIRARKKRLLSRNGNLFSAYFVKNAPIYMWQDLDGRVRIDNLQGKTLKSFHAPAVYGHVLSTDLETYIYSDIGWGLYKRLADGQFEQWKAPWGKAYLGFGKILNLQLSPDDRLLLQSGSGYEYDKKFSLESYARDKWKELVMVALWDVVKKKPKASFPGNIAKTYATFSPDGKYVVSGDEGGRVIVWDTQKTKELYRLGSLFHGVITNPNESWEKWVYDKTGLISYPKDYSGQAVLSLKFIDLDNHYLRITANQHYAILYAIDNPLPLKYLDLGTDPYPATREYARNTAIDSAPAAGILVTGQANGPGINVYRYDKATRTLKRIWVAR